MSDIKRELKNRIELMGKLFRENPNYFVEIYEDFEIENGIAIAMELCKYNLKKHISGIMNPKASDVFYFLVEINKCFKFLQSKNESGDS